MEAKGTPAMVQRVAVAPPQSRVGVLSEAERAALIAHSPLRGRYDQPVDRESAYEMLTARARQATEAPSEPAPADAGKRGSEGGAVGDFAGRVLKSALNQAASQIGRQIVRGLLGSLLGGKR